jgi:hypothetical protein
MTRFYTARSSSIVEHLGPEDSDQDNVSPLPRSPEGLYITRNKTAHQTTADKDANYDLQTTKKNNYIDKLSITHIIASIMASGSCLCGNVSIEYTGEPALKVLYPSLYPFQTLSNRADFILRHSATAPTAKKSAAAPSASTTLCLAKASKSPVPQNPTPKLLIRARRSLRTSVASVGLRFTEMERISRV